MRTSSSGWGPRTRPGCADPDRRHPPRRGDPRRVHAPAAPARGSHGRVGRSGVDDDRTEPERGLRHADQRAPRRRPLVRPARAADRCRWSPVTFGPAGRRRVRRGLHQRRSGLAAPSSPTRRCSPPASLPWPRTARTPRVCRPGSFSSAWAYRLELSDRMRRLARPLVATVDRSGLRCRPGRGAAEPRLHLDRALAGRHCHRARGAAAGHRAHREGPSGGRRSVRVWPWTGLIGVYGGYFGAAQGVMLMAALGLVYDADPQRANAAKNILAATANVTAAVVFALSGAVVWLAAARPRGGIHPRRVCRRSHRPTAPRGGPARPGRPDRDRSHAVPPAWSLAAVAHSSVVGTTITPTVVGTTIVGKGGTCSGGSCSASSPACSSLLPASSGRWRSGGRPPSARASRSASRRGPSPRAIDASATIIDVDRFDAGIPYLDVLGDFRLSAQTAERGDPIRHPVPRRRKRLRRWMPT